MRVGQVPRQVRPFPLAHLHQRGQRLLERLLHRRPEIFRLRHLLVRLEHARRAHQLIQRHRRRAA